MVNIARRLTILACVVLILVVGGLTAFWLYGAERLKQTVVTIEGNWRDRGGEISYENFRLDGYPMWFRIRVDKPMVGLPQVRTPWHWEGPPLRMRMSPFAPRGRVLFPGHHRLDITAFNTPLSFAIDAKNAEGRYRGRIGEARYEVLGDTLSVVLNGQPPLNIRNVDFEITRIRGVTDHLKPSAQFSFEIDDVTLPAGSLPEQFRSRPIDLALLQGQVLGPYTPEFNRASATAWRDIGGTIEVESVELRWGPLKLVAVGTMALDENLQPLAALTATITGFNETIDALASTGAIEKNQADSAKTLLGLLAKPPRLLGGPPEITVPVTIQNQRLSMGPVALMTVPSIVWPD